MPTDQDDCTVYTRMYEDAKVSARKHGRISDIYSVHDKVKRAIRNHEAVLEGEPLAPSPGSPRPTPREYSTEQLACLTSLDDRITEESNVNQNPLGDSMPPDDES